MAKIKKCTICKVDLVAGENFNAIRSKSYGWQCKACISDKQTLKWFAERKGLRRRDAPQTPEHVRKRAEAMKATIAANPRKCVMCGIEFVRTGAAQRYCSGQCWNKKARQKRRNGPRFSIPKDYYGALLEAQGFRCAICRANHKTNARRDSLAVDHCHKTNVVRGLLCHRCNTAIGLLKDDPKILEAARIYLARFDIPKQEAI